MIDVPHTCHSWCSVLEGDKIEEVRWVQILKPLVVFL